MVHNLVLAAVDPKDAPVSCVFMFTLNNCR